MKIGYARVSTEDQNLARQEPLQEALLLDLAAFAVRPMDRAMNNVRQKDLAMIDPAAIVARA